jgi:hypothetical protein
VQEASGNPPDFIVDIIGGLSFKGLMGPFSVVQSELCRESLSKIRTVFKLVEIEILVLHSPPKSFDDNIVLPKFSMIDFLRDSTLLGTVCNKPQESPSANPYGRLLQLARMVCPGM